MKSILFTILFLSAFHLSQAQVKLNHIAVYVEDLSESKSFYSTIIGLEEIEEPFKDGLHVWYKLGSSQLHLIQGKWQATTINKNNHLCFSVPDLSVFLQKLKDSNIDYEDWPGKAGATTERKDGVEQVYFRDPNGYWIEVNDDY